MKKLLCTVFALLFVFLASCSGGGEETPTPERPPAFSVLEKNKSLKKHAERGESASFSKEEIESLVGETVTYITVKSLPEADSGSLIFSGKPVLLGQSVPASQLGYLNFIPTVDCREASFGFSCDSKSFKDKELKCEIIFADGKNLAPIAADSTVAAVSGIALTGNLDIDEPNGDAYTVNVISYPSSGYISVDKNGKYVYVPEDGFSGKDSMVYTVTDEYGSVSSRATLDIEVSENVSGILFADMQESDSHIYAHRLCSRDIMVYRRSEGKYYFDPSATVSKLDFLVMMMCVSGDSADVTAVADSAVTDDSGISSGLKGFLSAANEKGLLLLTDGKFTPKAEITVADAAYMIAKTLSLPSVTDVNSAINAAVSAGILKTEGGVVDPKRVLSKEEIAELLCLMEDYMTKNNMFRELS